jgi:hypothetical protein
LIDDSPAPCSAVHSCTDPNCGHHRFDLYAALIGVADAWIDSLPQEPLSRRPDLEAAFHAVARLAAAEVFG